jgi:branched-chain amino acid transport system ATP-binding protein
MLAIKGLHSGYGAIEVLHGVDIEVGTGTIVAVIGANGAGKTTLLMTICGRPRAASGDILFEGETVAQLPTFELVRRGIAHVPEGRRIFPRMSVLENLQMGAFAVNPKHFSSDLEFTLHLFPQLTSRLPQYGGTLSGGEQQMLAIARALMSRPRLLLLDEPSLGLAPLIVQQVFEIVAFINRERRTAILLVEQNAFRALKLADRAYVMVNGRVAREGAGAELLHDPAVRAAYLGASPGAPVADFKRPDMLP